MQENTAARRWSSGRTFLIASIGGAIGLGNIWRFPYIMGENGGGAFVFVYLIAAFLVAVPILSAEVAIGRHGRASPYTAMASVATESGRWASWGLIGGMGLLTGYLIMTFYSVIAGSTIDYLLLAMRGAFTGLTKETAEALSADLNNNPLRLGGWHTVFMLVSCFIVGRGLRRGIEAAVRLLMPLLLLLLLAVIAYALVEGDAAAGLQFMFDFRFEQLSADSALEAISHAFFSIGVAMGLMMMYGAFAPREVSLPQTCIGITVADTGVAVLAGIAIFPLVFANGLEPGSGPSLVFLTLPIAFGGMPGGNFFGALFFLLLAFAALTSAIALMEAAVSLLQERLKLGRWTATCAVGATMWGLGWLTVLSFGAGESWNVIAGMNPFDLIDYLTATIMMPLGGALMALFAGWRMKRAILLGELGWKAGPLFYVWLVLLRVVAPAAILIIMYNALFG